MIDPMSVKIEERDQPRFYADPTTGTAYEVIISCHRTYSQDGKPVFVDTHKYKVVDLSGDNWMPMRRARDFAKKWGVSPRTANILGERVPFARAYAVGRRAVFLIPASAKKPESMQRGRRPLADPRTRLWREQISEDPNTGLWHIGSRPYGYATYKSACEMRRRLIIQEQCGQRERELLAKAEAKREKEKALTS